MQKKALDTAKQLLASLQGKNLGLAARIEEACTLAKLLLVASKEEKTYFEKQRDRRLHRFLQDQKGKAFLSSLFDTAFRSKKSRRIVDQVVFLFKRHNILPLLSLCERFFVRCIKAVGFLVPVVFAKGLQYLLLHEMKKVILPGEKRALKKALKKIQASGFSCNLNHLGEAILGQDEATKRIHEVLHDLENPYVHTISIKISSIYCPINVLAFDETLKALKEQLRLLLRKAYEVNKTITLDMEEYKDLELTCVLFQEVLSEPEFIHTSCGIALQSYIPDSFAMQKQLTEWAIKRQGAPIKIRLVKGANLGMEQVEASSKEWPQAPFTSKLEVDSHFKKMLHYGMQQEHAKYVHLGIASHNLFDIAYALILQKEMGCDAYSSFEMLSGMAPYVARVVKGLSENVLLYCPCAKKTEFHTAMAYLMRRLDENTQKENFLTHFFDLEPQTKAWIEQEEAFLLSALQIDTVESRPRRCQNRYDVQHVLELNVADTDWSQKQNRVWANEIVAKWQNAFHEIPLVIDGAELDCKAKKQGIDPSTMKAAYTYSLATRAEADFALKSLEHEAKKMGYNTLSGANFALKASSQLFGKKPKYPHWGNDARYC